MSFAFLFLLLVQALRPEAPPDLPATAGVYYRQLDAWTSLIPAPLAEIETRGIGNYINTNGLTGLAMSVACPGTRASKRIPDPRPVFYVRDTGSAKEALIVRFDHAKDHRLLQTSPSDATVANKGGFKKNDLHRVSVTVYSNDLFSVTPEANLAPGEYLLSFGSSLSGYDFGVDGRKK
jgi:hypothetical protein